MPAELRGDAEVEADRLGVADVEVAVGLRREAGHGHRTVLAGGRRSSRDDVADEVKPKAKEIDEKGIFPRDTVRQAAELGLTGVSVPEKWGGVEMDTVSYCLVIEESQPRLRLDRRDPVGQQLAGLRPRC